MRLPSRQTAVRRSEETRAKGISLTIVACEIEIGATAAAAPTMSKLLKIFDPTILPKANPVLPFRAETTDVNSSGALVPIATIVRPMTISGMFIFRAMAAAPSVNLSAPQSTAMTPMRM